MAHGDTEPVKPFGRIARSWNSLIDLMRAKDKGDAGIVLLWADSAFGFYLALAATSSESVED